MRHTFILLVCSFITAFANMNCSAKKQDKVGNTVNDLALQDSDSANTAPRHTPVTYTQADSALVVKLLEEGATMPATTNFMVYYGKKFLGVPYVASTLEVNPTEQLVVNLHELDCTTYVETVLALTLATKEGGRTFDDFCCQLQRIRYHHGKLDGYPSRNHYFSMWIESNSDQGIVEEITSNKAPFSATQTIDLHYMSMHPDKYDMLKNNKTDQQLIREKEKSVNGKIVRYIPKSRVGGSATTLSMVKDGDILALVTTKDGLDVGHLGIAVWGKDGKLHLMNASYIYHKVVLDNNTLYSYQQRQKSQTGTRVVRVVE